MRDCFLYLVTPSLLTYVDGGYTATRFDQADLFSDFALPVVLGRVFRPIPIPAGSWVAVTAHVLNMSWIPIPGHCFGESY